MARRTTSRPRSSTNSARRSSGIGCAPDGLNINDKVGATHPEALVAAVKAHGADIGVALDGDADRLQLVDANGRLYNGDELLYLMTVDRLDHGESVPGVVGTLMTNMAVEVALKSRGIEFVRAKVGDRYVLEELEKRGWLLGGEGSGHLLALDKHTTGDGLISALQVLKACVRSGRSIAQLLEGVQLFPQTLLNVRLQAGPGLEEERSAGRRNPPGRGRAGRPRPRPDPSQRHRARAAHHGRGTRRGTGTGPPPSGWLRPSRRGNGVMGQATVVAVHRSASHSFSKFAEDAIMLVEGLGVEGDAHSGRR